ncbi:MAG: hypothetical protein NT010_10750 [Proteobacteria bacterium]|nr:hypothetical protein [Pseudomonadota bacterium]
MIETKIIFERGEQSMKKGFLTILAMISLMFVPLIASAEYTSLDFDVIDGGTISYLNLDGPYYLKLNGTGLRVDRITASDDYGNSTSLEITNGMLNFTSGNHISGWSWGSGGSITITGGVKNPDGSQLLPIGAMLMSGSFNSAEVVPSGPRFKVAVSEFSDTKNPTLVSYFGFDTNSAWAGNFDISFSTLRGVIIGDFFNSTSVWSGDVYNALVPIPPPILLLGAGLIGIGFVRKRVF